MVDPNWPWDVIQAAAAIIAVFVAWFQIGSLKRQQKGWNTLEACEKYDYDPVLNDALRSLRDARYSGDLHKNPRPLRLDTTILLNYLEGIATGVAQGFYNERIVRDHLEPIIRDHVSEFLEPGMFRRMEMDKDPHAFDKLKALIVKWDAPKTWFKF